MTKGNRAALYVRASTDRQTVEQQAMALRRVAEGRGWQIVETYRDEGISGAKRRDKRPGLDSLLKDARRGKFDIAMAWAIDRLGRSTSDLLGTMEDLGACKVNLYIDQQNIDTTTPMGELMFTVVGAFAQFERQMIKSRIILKLHEKKEEIKRNGKFVTKAGIVRSKLGRPGAEPDKLAKARQLLAQGQGIRKVASQLGLGNGTVAQLKNELQAVA